MVSCLLSLSLLTSLISASTLAKTPTATVVVDTSLEYQGVDGFGISEAFGHAAILQALPGNISSAIMDFLFSNDKGAGLTILRNDITNIIEPTDPGRPNATPDYIWDYNDVGQVWVAQQAMARGLTTLYADAWSAPPYMKTNNNTVCFILSIL